MRWFLKTANCSVAFFSARKTMVEVRNNFFNTTWTACLSWVAFYPGTPETHGLGVVPELALALTQLFFLTSHFLCELLDYI